MERIKWILLAGIFFGACFIYISICLISIEKSAYEVKHRIYKIDNLLPAQIEQEQLDKEITFSKGSILNSINLIDSILWVSVITSIFYWLVLFILFVKVFQKSK